MGKANLYIRLKDNKDLLNFLAFCNHYNNIDKSSDGFFSKISNSNIIILKNPEDKELWINIYFYGYYSAYELCKKNFKDIEIYYFEDWKHGYSINLNEDKPLLVNDPFEWPSIKLKEYVEKILKSDESYKDIIYYYKQIPDEY